jgi:hypothetical protein
MSERTGVRVAELAVGALVAIAVAVLSVLVAGMRWKKVTNPRVMRTAGSAGTQTSVIRHIALPYGTRTDWVRNVIAATAEGAHQIPARTLRTLRLFAVTECLSLRMAG